MHPWFVISDGKTHIIHIAHCGDTIKKLATNRKNAAANIICLALTSSHQATYPFENPSRPLRQALKFDVWMQRSLKSEAPGYAHTGSGTSTAEKYRINNFI
jgi:hypothetical protein